MSDLIYRRVACQKVTQSMFFQIRLQQVDLIAELKKRQVSPQVREGKDGAIEDIITGNTPQVA